MIKVARLLRSAPSSASLVRVSVRVAETTSVCCRFKSSVPTAESKNEKFPDYNTSVNVHEHKLTRPQRPPPKREKLKEFLSDTKVQLMPSGKF